MRLHLGMQGVGGRSTILSRSGLACYFLIVLVCAGSRLYPCCAAAVDECRCFFPFVYLALLLVDIHTISTTLVAFLPISLVARFGCLV